MVGAGARRQRRERQGGIAACRLSREKTSQLHHKVIPATFGGSAPAMSLAEKETTLARPSQEPWRHQASRCLALSARASAAALAAAASAATLRELP